MSFTPGALFASMLFGSIGIGAFIYGKKNGSLRPLVLGIVLMVYPYFVSQLALLYGIGIALTAALFLFRE
jgi:hypothetical protein